MRQELVDLVFHIAATNDNLSPDGLHRAATQSLGLRAAGTPYRGPRHALGRDIASVHWTRVYDLVVRLWPDFVQAYDSERYRDGINRIFAGYGIAWDLDADGRLRRVTHPELQVSIHEALGALSDARFEYALMLFNAARDAYDARPRRDRDACANAFDALEAIGKIVRGQPTATFGAVLQHMRANNFANQQILGVLEAINTLRNRNFGHGVPFTLNNAEIDFAYGSMVNGIVLLAR